MSKLFTTSILAIGLASPALAQIPGDAYFCAPGIGNTGGFALSATGVTDSVINGATEVIGTTLAAPTSPINSTDTVVANGGGNFVLTIRMDSVGDVCPAGFNLGGVPADIAGFFLGANAGADPINFTNVALVNSAAISVLDLTGAVGAGPFDISGFANFADPAFGGGWNGSLGVTFGAGSVGGIGGFELVVDYTEGGPLGTFTNSGIGCPAAAPVALSADAPPMIGQSVTITASDLPASAAAASMMVGVGASQNLPLDVIGMTGCSLYVDNIIVTAPMSVAGTDATWTLTIANDPGAIGFAINVQSLVLAPGENPLGVVTSDLGSLVVGG